MADVTEIVPEAVEHAGESRLNSYVALLVAITAVMMALCNIKDGNVVQAMSQAQAHGVDAWSYFESKSTKQHIAEDTADQFDMADAAFSISVALYGITALTRRRWLLVMALLATLFGAFSGACGFLGASFHPSWLTGWLG